jgi:hypothetical protein
MISSTAMSNPAQIQFGASPKKRPLLATAALASVLGLSACGGQHRSDTDSVTIDSTERIISVPGECAPQYILRVRSAYEQSVPNQTTVSCTNFDRVGQTTETMLNIPMPSELTSEELRTFLGQALYDQVKNEPAFKTSDYQA